MNYSKAVLLIALLISLLIPIRSNAQADEKIDVTDFVRETQQWDKDGNDMRLAWYIPTAYWRVALEGQPGITENSIRDIEEAFGRYLMICVADININDFGLMKFTEESDLRKTVSVTDLNGKVYRPLKEKDINSNTLYLSNSMAPMFENMLGQTGKAMHLYFFNIQDQKGKNLIDETKEGGFTVSHSGVDFQWSLPLAILLPPKICPQDQTKMPGDWIFCPYHGVELEDSK